MNLKIVSAVLTILGIHQAFASDTVHLDIEVQDDGSIKVQPTSTTTTPAGETLELGKCVQKSEVKSFPILETISRYNGQTFMNEPSQRVSESTLDLKSNAAAYVEGLQLLMAIKNSDSCNKGQTLLEQNLDSEK